MPEGEYLQYGGQAIIEGVMMRSPNYFSVACRAPNGEIVIETEALEKTWIGRQKWLKLPFLRGSLALIDAMALGIKAMKFASHVQIDEKYQPVVEDDGAAGYAATRPQGPSKRVQDFAVGATIVVSLGLGFFIFNYLPNLIAEFSQRGFGVTSGTVINFVAEVIKIIIFIGYIALIGQMKEIKEVFKYHGAEHKAINTLEAHEELNMENCMRQTRLHPRCGTSFAIVVLIVSMIFFPFVPRYPVTGQQGQNPLLDVTVRFFIELLILPIIAGIAYELIRLAGKFRTAAVIKALFAPGLATQYLTTRVPEEKHVEVALAALHACVEAESTAKKVGPEKEDALESSPLPVP